MTETKSPTLETKQFVPGGVALIAPLEARNVTSGVPFNLFVQTAPQDQVGKSSSVKRALQLVVDAVLGALSGLSVDLRAAKHVFDASKKFAKGKSIATDSVTQSDAALTFITNVHKGMRELESKGMKIEKVEIKNNRITIVMADLGTLATEPRRPRPSDQTVLQGVMAMVHGGKLSPIAQNISVDDIELDQHGNAIIKDFDF